MGQIMQRLLEGVQADLQAEERDLCAHLNAQAHLLVLEAHLNCLEGSGSGLDNLSPADRKGKGRQGMATPGGSPQDAAPAAAVAPDSSARGKRPVSTGDS